MTDARLTIAWMAEFNQSLTYDKAGMLTSLGKWAGPKTGSPCGLPPCNAFGQVDDTDRCTHPWTSKKYCQMSQTVKIHLKTMVNLAISMDEDDPLHFSVQRLSATDARGLLNLPMRALFHDLLEHMSFSIYFAGDDHDADSVENVRDKIIIEYQMRSISYWDIMMCMALVLAIPTQIRARTLLLFARLRIPVGIKIRIVHSLRQEYNSLPVKNTSSQVGFFVDLIQLYATEAGNPLKRTIRYVLYDNKIRNATEITKLLAEQGKHTHVLDLYMNPTDGELNKKATTRDGALKLLHELKIWMRGFTPDAHALNTLPILLYVAANTAELRKGSSHNLVETFMVVGNTVLGELGSHAPLAIMTSKFTIPYQQIPHTLATRFEAGDYDIIQNLTAATLVVSGYAIPSTPPTFEMRHAGRDVVYNYYIQWWSLCHDMVTTAPATHLTTALNAGRMYNAGAYDRIKEQTEHFSLRGRLLFVRYVALGYALGYQPRPNNRKIWPLLPLIEGLLEMLDQLAEGLVTNNPFRPPQHLGLGTVAHDITSARASATRATAAAEAATASALSSRTHAHSAQTGAMSSHRAARTATMAVRDANMSANDAAHAARMSRASHASTLAALAPPPDDPAADYDAFIRNLEQNE